MTPEQDTLIDLVAAAEEPCKRCQGRKTVPVRLIDNRVMDVDCPQCTGSGRQLTAAGVALFNMLERHGVKRSPLPTS